MNTVKYDLDGANIIEDVYIPEESYGVCNVLKCMVHDWLADGYCIKHWDSGMQKKPRKYDKNNRKNYQYL